MSASAASISGSSFSGSRFAILYCALRSTAVSSPPLGALALRSQWPARSASRSVNHFAVTPQRFACSRISPTSRHALRSTSDPVSRPTITSSASLALNFSHPRSARVLSSLRSVAAARFRASRSSAFICSTVLCVDSSVFYVFGTRTWPASSAMPVLSFAVTAVWASAAHTPSSSRQRATCQIAQRNAQRLRFIPAWAGNVRHAHLGRGQVQGLIPARGKLRRRTDARPHGFGFVPVCGKLRSALRNRTAGPRFIATSAACVGPMDFAQGLGIGAECISPRRPDRAIFDGPTIGDDLGLAGRLDALLVGYRWFVS